MARGWFEKYETFDTLNQTADFTAVLFTAVSSLIRFSLVYSLQLVLGMAKGG